MIPRSWFSLLLPIERETLTHNIISKTLHLATFILKEFQVGWLLRQQLFLFSQSNLFLGSSYGAYENDHTLEIENGQLMSILWFPNNHNMCVNKIFYTANMFNNSKDTCRAKSTVIQVVWKGFRNHWFVAECLEPSRNSTFGSMHNVEK